jgi:hypothetical protein
VLLVAALVLQAGGASGEAPSVDLRDVSAPPLAHSSLDSTAWGPPQITVATRSGQASVWLLRAADSVFVVARVPDRTPSWADAVSLCIDLSGDRAPAPAHDDFQFTLRRVLDSSVVYRGRNGRWQPPHDDPDWRVGATHAGGGWEAAAASDSAGWSLVLRLDRAWFAGEGGRRPGIAFIVHNDDPSSWGAWPSRGDRSLLQDLDRTPSVWGSVRLPH